MMKRRIYLTLEQIDILTNLLYQEMDTIERCIIYRPDRKFPDATITQAKHHHTRLKEIYHILKG